MKVSKDVLERVFNSFEERKERTDDNMVEMLDPDRHLHFVDAFDMPLWNWSVERGSFEKYVNAATKILSVISDGSFLKS